MLKKYMILLLIIFSSLHSKEVTITGKITGVHIRGVGGGYGILHKGGKVKHPGGNYDYLCFFFEIYEDEKIMNMFKNLEESGKLVTIKANRTNSLGIDCNSVRILTQDSESTNIFDQSTLKLSDNEYMIIKKENPNYAVADSELSKAYLSLKKILNPNQREQLKIEQIAWIKQRDQKAYETDTKGSKKYIEVLSKLTKDRTEYLSIITK